MTFFVGWSPRSALPLSRFLTSAAIAVFALFGALAFGLGVAIDDPGGGGFTGDKDVTGVLIADPYPMLVVNGHTILLSGGGKRGVQDDARPLDGKTVRVTGAGVKRGDLDMILVGALEATPGEAPAIVPVPLGSWRLTGEICDGKCALGVMHPGRSLAHKACANVCLIGGVPPVLATTSPVLGTSYLLIGGADDRALPDALRDHVAILSRMDGTLERIGDALLFRTDVTKAETP